MDNLTQFICSACGKEKAHDSCERFIPLNWCNRNIEGDMYLLCESCGIEGPGASDISPSLCEKFKARGLTFKGCEVWKIK